MMMTFEYTVQADSTIEVGAGGPSGYVGAGSVTITNDFGGSGSYTVPYGGQVGYLGYANDDMQYGKYLNDGRPACPPAPDEVQAIQTTGDAYPGPGQPGTNPWNGCLKDPHGVARVAPNGGYDSDRGTGLTIGPASWYFGFLGSASTGYTNYIYDNYHNHGTTLTYVCGSTWPDAAPVLYNSPS
ncbi:MAG TPA: hypothetical protein VGS21_01455 [Acidimicrobiales bacterium]|nr:hypothetical protein [Acidimicrobiales bacterium]